MAKTININRLKTMVTILLAFIVLSLFTVTAYAQPTDPTEGDCNIPGGGGPDEPCPLDTWVYVLVIGAIIYGSYKLYSKEITAHLQEKTFV